MKSSAYIQGPYRQSSRGWATRVAAETAYAFGGVALVLYLCYALLLG